ncbi:AbrB family looped-hinge helix DNA binding protein [Rhizomicrobium palustre]|uniref:AbrB family looped-hinge helix DNA binding protein n=1 Tax=Rhizomicrobium palustre TaxID=189966 RepID=A0A846MZS5_9PROT|nr:AbrB/MazE/SpoVT family DNA-binding domain-containing protein [Rhizomicrobium palustre]NIK88813.1 AbrB family looped-hinge helix DNA binding protein [Rhizomicrobium palustre]
MVTTITSEGQITLPEELRDKAGIKPGDEVEITLGATGALVIQKPEAKRKSMDEYRQRLLEVANRGIISGITTDEIMEMTRGYSEDAEMEAGKP